MAGRNDSEMAFPDVVQGATVEHPTFGVGRVLLRTGTEKKSAKAIVKFKEEGEKKLALQYASLVVEKPEEEPAEGEAAGTPAQ